MRMVVKGFQQREGIDFTEIFSLVMKLTTSRSVLSIVAADDLHLEQLDVKTAFLHGDLEEGIYMMQPHGYIMSEKEQLVCKLKKSLYGLKQAPRQQYLKFDRFMVSSGLTRLQADYCCYFKWFENSYIILLLYVDMLIIGSSMKEIVNLKAKLEKEFLMKDWGSAKKILEIRISKESKKAAENITSLVCGEGVEEV